MLESQIANLLTQGLSGPVQSNPVLAATDLRQCLNHVYTALKPEFSEKSLQLEIELCDLPMIFPFDTHLVARVLTNLLENARRFTSPGGSVSISLAPYFWERRCANLSQGAERRRKRQNSPNAAKVVVADSGCGIAPEFHQEIFEECFSMPAPGCKASSGLGLAIARNIVQGHGGKIWVESAVGKGSKFCFLLPWVVSGAASAVTYSVEPTVPPFDSPRFAHSAARRRATEKTEVLICGD